MFCMGKSEIRQFTLILSNYFQFLVIVFTEGTTKLNDFGYFDVCRGVKFMPKLEDLKLDFAHTRILKLYENLKIQLKFCKGV